MSATKNRNKRALTAEETLKILDQGWYTADDKTITIEESVDYSVDNTKLIRPNGFNEILESANTKLDNLDFDTSIEVKNCTVLEALSQLTQINTSVGCLNFASAKNPGGGFLGGAQAQEESLSRASALYLSLLKHFEMYEYNRSQNTFLYSDYMIYSPEVLIFRDDNDTLLANPYKVSFVTSPAVNAGAMKQNNISELDLVEQTMFQRIDKVLAVFVANGIENLVLGAWGCGVFQNEPKDIAQYFARYLTENGKYSKAFKNILFAVLDRNAAQENIAAFEKVFNVK
ncbi:TIGR02452 family protein [Emticicia sp. C21]|uniref:TIGR02452 family protein n=1 Tax=Emticicia sp. C21 TaxID=2302915 RepID=UPI0013142C73|nr:TIGR02452 family protein [Emticicia sp. C21]